MKKNGLKRAAMSTLWIVMLLALSAVTAFADVAPEPLTPTPVPLDTKGKVLIAAVVVIAAAIIAWIVIHGRKDKNDK